MIKLCNLTHNVLRLNNLSIKLGEEVYMLRKLVQKLDNFSKQNGNKGSKNLLELSKWLVLKDLKAKNCSNSCPKCEEPTVFFLGRPRKRKAPIIDFCPTK